MKMMVSFDLRKLFDHFVALFIVISTFFWVPVPIDSGIDPLAFGYSSQELFFRFGALLVFGISLFLKPIRTSDFKWFAGFMILSFLGLHFGGFDQLSSRAVLNIVCGILFAKTVADYCDQRNINIFCYWFLAVLIWNLIACIQQWFRHDPLFSMPVNLGHKDMMVGFMRMKVHLGCLAALLSPFLFFLSPVFVLISIPMLCVANSSVAVASFVISICFLVFFRFKKRYFVLLMISLFALGAFYVLKFDMPGGQFSERFKVWEYTYSAGLKTHPFVGNGAGSFYKLGISTAQETSKELLGWFWAHNEFIQSFFEFGFIGLFIIGMYLRQVFKGFWKFRDDRNLQLFFSSILVVIAVSFFHFPFHLGRLVGVCLFSMGMFQGRLRDLEDGY